MSQKLLILAGGMSSRMKKDLAGDSRLDPALLEQANTLPKAMLGIGKGGRPFLDFVLYNAATAGCDEVLLLLNPNDAVTQPYYESLMASGTTWNLHLSFARQYIPAGREKPLGTADAIEQALAQHPDWQQSRFIVCNSDNLYPVHVFRLLWDDPHPNAMPNFDTLGYDEARIRNCAIIRKNEAGFLTDLLEKPSDEEWAEIIKTHTRIGISWNIFAFQGQDILPFLQKTPLSARNEKELPLSVKRMAHEKPDSIFTIPVSEIIPDLTSKADIAHIQAILEGFDL